MRVLKTLKEIQKEHSGMTIDAIIDKFQKQCDDFEDEQKKIEEDFIEKYSNKVIKHINKDGIFGNTLLIYKIKDIKFQTITHDYKKLYTLTVEHVEISDGRAFYEETTSINKTISDLEPFEFTTEEEFQFHKHQVFEIQTLIYESFNY